MTYGRGKEAQKQHSLTSPALRWQQSLGRWDLRTGEISWDAKTTHGQQLPWTMFWNSHVLLLFDDDIFTVWDIGKHNGVQGSWSRLNSCKARPHLEGLLPFSVPHLSLRNEKCNILHLSHVSDRKRNVHVRAWNKTLYIAVVHQKNV